MNTSQRDDAIDLMNLEHKYRILAYRLAGALMDEIHYSQMPSEDSLTLLSEALALYPDSEFAKRYANWNIDKMEAVGL